MSLVSKVINRLYWYYKVNSRFLFKKNNFRIVKGSNCDIAKNVEIFNSNIIVGANSELVIGAHCKLNNVNMVLNGKCYIGEKNTLGIKNTNSKINFLIKGVMRIGNSNKLEGSVLQRFNSELSIGDYNVINKGSQLRSDEKISIGDFNQISYDIMIWDTNTHNMYKANQRRELTKANHSGFEYEKPKTNPITVGHDNWIGKGVVILKGTKIGDKCIVAYGTILSNANIKDSTTVMQKIELRMVDNDI